MNRPKTYAWIASLATLGAILASVLLPRGGNPYVRGLGVLLLASAAVFIFIPFMLLRKYGALEAGESYQETRTVVDHGLYAITRHPQYLGYMLLAWGFAGLSQHWGTALLAVVSIVAFYGQAVKEEQYALTRFRCAYERYLRRVPRFNIVLGLIRLARDGER